MSFWTYLHGTMTVSPMGRTQAEKRYILETVLNHLPNVTGSERDMQVYIVQKNGTNSSCSCDEFGYQTDNLIDRYGQRSFKNGWLRTQEEYILVVDGSFRDRFYKTTYREFQNWICRLAKRVSIKNVLVEISGYGENEHEIITNKNDRYGKMFEYPSWSNDDEEPTWCEYLMPLLNKDTRLPVVYQYKYFEDKNNDEIISFLKERCI